MANDLRDPDNLPEPKPLEALAVSFTPEGITFYFSAAGELTGYKFDVVDALNLSYLLLGCAMQKIREIGQSIKKENPTRRAFESLLGDIKVDLDEGAGNEGEPPA